MQGFDEGACKSGLRKSATKELLQRRAGDQLLSQCAHNLVTEDVYLWPCPFESDDEIKMTEVCCSIDTAHRGTSSSRSGFSIWRTYAHHQ